ncbi:MAG TPA: PH domain-containing protein [Mycobacteriales bacterium]|nr:PH domain-containing protein [Mycobacteriales bacterium]
MGYPRRLLNDDEEMVFDLRPHWKAVVGATLLAPLIVGLASFGVARIPEGSLQTALRAIAVVVAAGLFFAFCVVPYLKWLSTHFVVTTRRVIMRSGVLGRSGRDLPLFRINDVTFEHSFFERLLGSGTLIVESAGERGQVTLADIPHPEDVQRELYKLIELDDLRRRGEA